MFFALLYVSETTNAQSGSPTTPQINQAPSPIPTPQGNIKQPNNPPQNNPSLPSIEHYQKLVEMAHKEVEGVRSVYVWLSGLLAFIISVGVALGAYFMHKSVGELKESMKKEVQLHMERGISEIKREVDENLETWRKIKSDTDKMKSDIDKLYTTAENSIHMARSGAEASIKETDKRASEYFERATSNTDERIKELIHIEMEKMSKNVPNV
jgi:hypothetical protein